VLLGQLVLQFGWDVVRTDIYYTFMGRNFATDPEAFSAAAKAFYAEHNIVFWLNLPESGLYRNLLWAFRVLFQDHAVHTPPWSLVVLAFAAAEIVRRLRSRRAPSALSTFAGPAFARPSRFFAHFDWEFLVKDASALAPFILVALGIAVFYLLASHPEIGVGLAPRSSSWILELLPIAIAVGIFTAAVLCRALPKPRNFFDAVDWTLVIKDATVLARFILVALSVVALGYILLGHPGAAIRTLAPMLIGIGLLYVGMIFFTSSARFNHPVRILGASAFIAAVLAFLLAHPSLYAGAAVLEPIWRPALAELAGYTTGGALVVSVMLLLAGWHACGSPAATDDGRLLDRLFLFLAALLVAYLLVYFVFTGYVLTGYFVRYLSLTIYFNDLLLALGLVAMIDCARGWYARFRQAISWHRVVCGSGAAGAVVGLAAAVLYWGSLQTFLFRKLPPNEISFFSVLSEPPFRGATFAALAYGGTVAYFTKNWAYLDGLAALAQTNLTLGPDGYNIERDSPYVWFADRAVNTAYHKPNYFLAMTYQFYGVAQGLAPAYLMTDRASERPRAGDVPLVRAIREGRTSYLHPVEVARDPSVLDRWSIVQLDWDFPPFLRRLEGGEFVTLDASPTEDGTRVRIHYSYAHQEGAPETGTRIALFAQSRCAGFKQEGLEPLSPSTGAPREFNLPSAFAGTIRAEVQPATATKTGPSYGSAPLEIGSADACRDGSASR
jgi:hypothetical protein